MTTAREAAVEAAAKALHSRQCGIASAWGSLSDLTKDVFKRDAYAAYDAILAALRQLSPEGEGWELGDPVTLMGCPPGLFDFNGTLGFKTEYGAAKWLPDSETFTISHWPDVYVVESGEAFWGGTKTHEDRAALIVRPVVSLPAAPAGEKA